MSISENVQFANIRFSKDGAYEIDNGIPVVHVAAHEIVSVQLEQTVASERPCVAAIIGTVLLAISCAPLVMLYNWYLQGGTFRAVLVLAVGLVVPSWYFLRQSFEIRWILRVVTQSESRKLVPSSNDEKQIREFLANASERFAFVRVRQ